MEERILARLEAEGGGTRTPLLPLLVVVVALVVLTHPKILSTTSQHAPWRTR